LIIERGGNMRTSESTEIVTRFIPKLVELAKVPIQNIKTDCSTERTRGKRIDIIISSENNLEKDFERKIITIIEVKQTGAEVLDFYDENDDVPEEFIQKLEDNLTKYAANSSSIDYTGVQFKDWYNALIQGLWKARNLELDFFGVTNTLEIVFYHTETLKPLEIKRLLPFVNEANGIESLVVLDKLKGLPSYTLLQDLKDSITKTNRVCDYSNLGVEEQNEKVSMQENGFIEFLDRIHNVFYKDSLKGQKKYLGDVILTFIFFKYLEERVQILGKSDRYSSGGIKLWSNWLTKADIKESDKQILGKEIYNTIEIELGNLKNNEDETDTDGEFIMGYEKEYREFHAVLVGIDNIPKTSKGYEFVFRIYQELNGINTSTNDKGKSLYLHACNFDVYGAIYEKFKDKSEKEELGQYYTKRHISGILAKLTLRPYILKIKKEINDLRVDKETKGNQIEPNDIVSIIEKHYSEIRIIDPSCGTGGLLTECYDYLEHEYRSILGGKNAKIEALLSKDIFSGIDVEEDCVKKSKLNMFFAGDGHTHISRGNSIEALPHQKEILKSDCEKNKWNVIVSNPPYGKGKEYQFVKKYIDALKYGGRIGIIIPNGILENPSKYKFRKLILSSLKIESIISLNRFVFAPYTKQKTYMVIGYKRNKTTIDLITKNFIETDSGEVNVDLTNTGFESLRDKIWCYILDYDGYNLSDNRWATDLIKIVDGIPKYIHNDIPDLIQNYLSNEINSINQIDINGQYIGVKEDDNNYSLSKAKFIELNTDINSDNYFNLLPEFYMRPHEPEYITEADFTTESNSIIDELISLVGEFGGE